MGSPPGKTGKDGRRSQRVVLSIPVAVYGHDHAGNPFQEATVTSVVNAHGALITLATPVQRGQKLMLTNRTTEEDQECIVVYLGRSPGGKMEVGIEFTHPAPSFWRIAFPPADWRPTPE
jgi:hypothetical protein